jgi:hypothetical protein
LQWEEEAQLHPLLLVQGSKDPLQVVYVFLLLVEVEEAQIVQ